MGWLKSIVGAAAPVVGGIVGGPVGSALGGMVGGALGGSGNGATTSTSTQQLDPRVNALLWGQNGSGGLLQQFAGIANTPQGHGSAALGNMTDSYLANGAGGDIDTIRATAGRLTQGNATPGVSNPLWLEGARVNAPSQNSLDTRGAFDQFINGDEGSNPYLLRGLQAATDLTNTSYLRNQDALTNTLTRSVLPGIDSTAIASGGFGGSRHGVAQGNALSDYTKQLSDANLQLGQANSANTTGAQADSFNQGRNRSLSALQSLSAQQYGLASQNAAMDQQARLANQGTNTQYTLANQGAQLQTNAQNNAAAATGAGLLSGNLGQLYGYNQANDNYGYTRAAQASGLLAPFLGANSSSTQSTPYTSNTGAGILGGAAAGLGLFNQLGGSGQPMSTFNVSPGVAPVNSSGLQNMGWMSSLLGG